MADKCAVKGCYAYGRFCRIPGHMKPVKEEKPSVTIVTGKPVKKPPVIKPGVKKKRKGKIAYYSKKRAKEQRKYAKMVKDIVNAEGEECEVKSPVCQWRMRGMNHKQKRSMKNLRVKKNLQKCCIPCNEFIEANPDWAKENGHLISKFDKDFLSDEVT